MTVLDWTLSVFLFTIYIVCLFTVCSLTFKKGYIALGIIGILFPFFWLIGAVLPAKAGSSYQLEEGVRMQRQLAEMTR